MSRYGDIRLPWRVRRRNRCQDCVAIESGQHVKEEEEALTHATQHVYNMHTTYTNNHANMEVHYIASWGGWGCPIEVEAGRLYVLYSASWARGYFAPLLWWALRLSGSVRAPDVRALVAAF